MNTSSQDRSTAAGAAQGTAALRPEREYRGYIIEPTDPVPPIPCWRQFAWSYAHKDYDGPEDNRCGHAESPEACMAEIDWREDD